MSAADATAAAVDHALALAAMGVSVFPLKPGEKTPLHTGWQASSTADADAIRAAWRMCPSANIGIPTGGSGLVVIDVDLHAANGFTALAEREAELGALPATVASHTGGGGAHLWFRAPAGAAIHNSAGKLGPGLDVRGDGGYIVAPGSCLADGGRYEWAAGGHPDEVPLAGLPAAWAARLRALARQPQQRADQQPSGTAVPEGERNSALASLAGTMRRRGMSIEAITAALLADNLARCDPPLSEVEVRRTAASVARYEPSTDSEPDTAPLTTELANAQRFVARHGLDVRFVSQWGSLAWDGRRFAPDSTGAVERLAKTTNLDLFRLAADVSDEKARGALVRHAHASTSAAGIRATVTLARTEAGVVATPADFDRDPLLLAVENGTLDLRTCELREHRRSDMISKLAAVRFDPRAEAPLFLAFLHRVMGDSATLVDYVQSAVGYTLTGRTDEHALFLCYGTGRNGKTTLFEVLRAVLGDYGQQTPFETFLASDRDSIRNDLARLDGARFVAASEAPAGRRLNEAVIKAITGGDAITARFLHKEYFEFRPQFKLWLAANHRPPARETNEGFWSRIRLIPFAVTIPPEERDRGLRDKLLAELPGVLNWALAGCLRWQRDGLPDAPAVSEATADYRAGEDAIATFLADSCAVAPRAEAPVATIYAAYASWCDRTNERPLTLRALGAELRGRGFATHEAGKAKTHTWSGIGLRADRGDDPPAGGAGRGGSEVPVISLTPAYEENYREIQPADNAPPASPADAANALPACPECGGGLDGTGVCWARPCDYGRACRDCGAPTGFALRPRCPRCEGAPKAAAPSTNTRPPVEEPADEPDEFATNEAGTLLCVAPGCQAELDMFDRDGRPVCARHAATTEAAR